MGKKCTHYFVLFCDRIQVYCDAVTSKMMIDHYFVDRFFRVRTFSWAEFDERSEEGSRNIVRTRKYHTTCKMKLPYFFNIPMKMTNFFTFYYMLLIWAINFWCFLMKKFHQNRSQFVNYQFLKSTSRKTRWVGPLLRNIVIQM